MLISLSNLAASCCECSSNRARDVEKRALRGDDTAIRDDRMVDVKDVLGRIDEVAKRAAVRGALRASVRRDNIFPTRSG